ncbi:hypothetical protein STEG23_016003 [Scotinomys teguina]
MIKQRPECQEQVGCYIGHEVNSGECKASVSENVVKDLTRTEAENSCRLDFPDYSDYPEMDTCSNLVYVCSSCMYAYMPEEGIRSCNYLVGYRSHQVP